MFWYDPTSPALFRRAPESIGGYYLHAYGVEARTLARQLRREGHDVRYTRRYWEVDSQSGCVFWRFGSRWSKNPAGL